MRGLVTTEVLAAAVAATDAGVLICDRDLPDTPIVFANEAFCRITGHALEEVLGRNCRFLQGAGTERATVDHLRAAIAEGQPAEAELLNYRKDGRPFWNALRLTPVADGSGRARFLVGVLHDVTERRRAEEALADEEAVLRAVVDASADAIIMTDVAGRMVRANAVAVRMFGYAEAELVGRGFGLVVPGGGLDQPPAGRHKEGSTFPVELTAAGIVRRGVRMTVHFVRDVSERERAEAALRESEARFRNMADHAPVALWLTDREGSCTYINSRWCELTGQTLEEATGFSWLDCVHPDDLPATLEAYQVVRAGQGPFQAEYRLRRPDGGWRWVIDTAAPRYDGRGAFLGYVGSVLDIHERRQAEERASELGRRLDALVSSGIIGVTVVEGDRVVEANDAFLRMVDHTREDLVAGRLDWSSLTALDWVEAGLRVERELLATSSCRSLEKEYIRKDGTRVPVLLSAVLLDRKRRLRMCLIQDISERKRAEAALAEKEAKLRATQEHAGVGIAEVDAHGRYLSVNLALCTITGYAPDELLHRAFHELTHPDDAVPEREAYARVVAGTDASYTLEKRYVRKDGGERWIEVTASAVRDETGQFLYGVRVVQDIHDRKLAQERVRHLAHHDPLTGLPNRSLFQDRLRQALAQAGRYEEQGALLLLDLDRFKDANDTLGHDAGDAVLCEVARRLQSCVRESDTVARLGGDEFAITLSRLPSADAAAEVARKIGRALAKPVSHAGTRVHTGASIGITLFPDDGDDAGHLLKNADIALYKTKGEGGGTYCFFEAGLRRQVERRRGIEDELRLALARGEIVPFFQPKVRLGDGKVFGFEALARWRHPARGLIAPGEFLPVAEETGLAVRIGERILHEAAAQAASWRRQRLATGCIAVNVTGWDLRRGMLAATVRRVLGQTGLPPRRLVIEVTEGAFLGRGADRVADELQVLHAMGATVALDDFGTGYASLTHLKRFPVGLLKIDQSFVRDMLDDPGDAAIVRAVINLGHSLGMRVVAEGVETEELARWLRLQRCDYGQGFLFAPPMPAEAVPGWLRTRSPSLSVPAVSPAPVAALAGSAA